MLHNKSLLAFITIGAFVINFSALAFSSNVSDAELYNHIRNRLNYMVAPSGYDTQADQEIKQIITIAIQTIHEDDMCYNFAMAFRKIFNIDLKKPTDCPYTEEYVETALRTAFKEVIKQKASAKYGNSVGESVDLVIDSIFRDHTVSRGSMREFVGNRFDAYIEKLNDKHAQQALSERPKPTPTVTPAYAPTTNGYTTTTSAPAPRPSSTSTSYYPTTSSQPSTGSSAGGGAPSYSSTMPTTLSAAELETILNQQASHPINNGRQDDICTICQEPLENQARLGYPNCMHGAHLECAKKYVLDDKPCYECPVKTNQDKLEKNPHCSACNRNLKPNNKCDQCQKEFLRSYINKIYQALKTQQR